LSGGRRSLAKHLRVSLADLEKWIADEVTPPLDTFLRAVDVLIDETESSGSASEPGDTAPSQDCAPPDKQHSGHG
jgi:hypothetical protein